MPSTGVLWWCMLLCACVMAVRGAGSSFCDAPGWAREFQDDFVGSAVNTSNFHVVRGGSGGDPGPMPEWACRTALCTGENVGVHDGALWITSQRETIGDYNYTSGAVTTAALHAWTPAAAGGTFRACVSARLPGSMEPGRAQGLWPAIWFMPDDDACDPDEGEPDVLEMINGGGRGYATYHYETTWPAQPCQYPKGHAEITTNVSLAAWNSSFHEFAMERATSYIAFVYDGVTILNSSTSVHQPLLWNMPFYLIINTAVGGGWPGPPNASTVLPAEFVVDYVYVSLRQQEQE
jgi:beta-glucanase (GH16 family)